MMGLLRRGAAGLQWQCCESNTLHSLGFCWKQKHQHRNAVPPFVFTYMQPSQVAAAAAAATTSPPRPLVQVDAGDPPADARHRTRAGNVHVPPAAISAAGVHTRSDHDRQQGWRADIDGAPVPALPRGHGWTPPAPELALISASLRSAVSSSWQLTAELAQMPMPEAFIFSANSSQVAIGGHKRPQATLSDRTLQALQELEMLDCMHGGEFARDGKPRVLIIDSSRAVARRPDGSLELLVSLGVVNVFPEHAHASDIGYPAMV